MRLLCVLLALSWISIEALIQVDPTSGFFVDEYGRVRIFHGVNAVYKATPWYPEPQGFDPQNSLSAEDAQNLQNWGFNAVRLGVMFPGVEPTLGYFNTTYLDTMNGIIDTLYQYGIYSIVDTHQDLYNGKFCGEGVSWKILHLIQTGFPDWAVDETHSLPFAMPVGPVLLGEPPNGYPNLTLCHEMSFFEYYLSEAVGVAFQNLYNNTNGLQDEFATYWSTLAQYFNGAEGVLGYELINEPWAGNIYGDIELLLPGVADQKNLAPMYKLLNGAIREYDDEHIIFFEKAVSNEVGSNGLTEGPGGPLYNNRQAYSYHIYCAPTDSYGTPTNITACNIENSYLFEDSMKDMKDMGVFGGFLTEFGAVPNTPPSIDAIQYLTELADTKFQSWSYWQFKYFNDITTSGTGESFYDENGNLEQAKVKTLSRTYAQAIAGTPSLMHFFPDNATFVLRYKWNTDITEPTIIFLNEAWYYPNGFKVDITPSSSGSYKQIQTNYIQVSKGAHVVNGEEILIEIKAM